MWTPRGALPVPFSGAAPATNQEVFKGPCNVVGFSIINLAVAAAGSIGDGALALVFYTMGASSHDTQWFGDRGIRCDGTLTHTVTAGTITGVLWVTGIERVEYSEDDEWLRNLTSLLSLSPPELRSMLPSQS